MSAKYASPSRRSVLLGGIGLGAALAMPARLSAQTSTIKIGALAPLTGAGGTDGPLMVAINRAVIQQVNAAGGILGQQVELIAEDDQTNPDAGVRATQKLVMVDKVPVIIDIWASAVAAAMLPICWENKVMAVGVAANDALADLPHQGYFLRTQPTSGLQAEQYARYAVEKKAKHLFLLMPQQQPFSLPMISLIKVYCEAKGTKVSSITYDQRKTQFRSEIDEVVASGADMIYLGGYTTEDIALTKEIYRAGYKGVITGTATGLTPELIQAVGPEVVEGYFTIAPIPALGSKAYTKVKELNGGKDANTIVCQAYDQINLVLLAIAAAKKVDGTAIRDNLRTVANNDGEIVDNAIDGAKALAAGKPIKYTGASGPCKFKPNGDLAEANFELRQIKGGKIVAI